MSNEKKLNSRLERLMAGLGGVAHDGVPRPAAVPAEPSVPSPAPGAPIDAHGVVPGWTWETDAQGRYTACSSEIAALLGAEPADLIGQPLTLIAVPGDSASRREVASATQAQRPLLDVRLEARAADGSARVVILNAMPLFDDTDQFHGYRGVAHVVEELPGPAASSTAARPAPIARPTPPVAAPPVGLPPVRPAPTRAAEPPLSAAAAPAAPAGIEQRPEVPVVGPRPSLPPLAPPVEPLRRATSPIIPARTGAWGLRAGEDGLAPIGEWNAPEAEEALASGELVARTTPAAAPSGAATEAAAAPQRALAVPIRLQNQTIGVLHFSDEANAQGWSEDDLALVKAVSDQLSLALENARLFDETRALLDEITRERERLSVLYDILQGLITRPDREAIFNTALSMAPRLGALHGYVLILGERESEAAFLSTLPGLDQLDSRASNAYALTIASQGLERWVLENGRPAIVADTRQDERWYTAPEHVQEAPARAVISVPLQTQRGSLRGVLAYTHATPGALGAEHLPLIESIARQVAVALENEQLRQLQRVQGANAQSLARAAQAMTRTLNEAELHQIVVEQIFTAFAADGVVLLRWIPSNNTFLPLAVEVAEQESSADRQAWPVLGRAFSATQRPDLHDSVENRRGRIVPLREEPDGLLRESMTMPLLYGGDVEGVVEVVHTGPIGGGLGQVDLELFGSILTAAASALQSARLYELQRQTAERLAEVDRLKSQFLANMSHELRTPLNSIIGFSRVILKGIDGPLTDLQSQDLSSINSAGQHLLGLINDILDMARIEAGKMELVLDEVDLHDTINGVMSTTVALVKEKPVRLIQDVAPSLPRVRADSMRVRQVLLNLLANAAKFTDSGTITLRAKAVEAVGPYSGRLEPFVEISVIDTGGGIAPEDMPKLFEPFSQVDASATRKVGGTGLGLSICRQLVDLHSGRIWAESELGKGSTFTFILPVGQPDLNIPQPSEPEPAATDRVVLAVDDDPGLVGLYRRYLEPHGYRVIGVNRSSEALARAAELRPLVVLLDVLMPNKDGWQVLTELKRSDQTRDIPVIMCTLVTEPDHAQELGAADYLTKPILEADLLRAVRRLPAPAPRAN